MRYFDPRSPPSEEALPIPVWVGGFSFAPDSQRFIALDRRDGSASLWNVTPLRPIEPLSFLGTNNSALKWSPDGRTLTVGDRLGNLTIWDFEKRRMITNFANQGTHVGTLKFYGRGRTLLSGLVSHPSLRRSARF